MCLSLGHISHSESCHTPAKSDCSPLKDIADFTKSLLDCGHHGQAQSGHGCDTNTGNTGNTGTGSANCDSSQIADLKQEVADLSHQVADLKNELSDLLSHEKANCGTQTGGNQGGTCAPTGGNQGGNQGGQAGDCGSTPSSSTCAPTHTHQGDHCHTGHGHTGSGHTGSNDNCGSSWQPTNWGNSHFSNGSCGLGDFGHVNWGNSNFGYHPTGDCGLGHVNWSNSNWGATSCNGSNGGHQTSNCGKPTTSGNTLTWGDYSFQLCGTAGNGATLTMTNKCSGETTTVWGDPHITSPDGTVQTVNGNFTFDLPNGLQVTCVASNGTQSGATVENGCIGHNSYVTEVQITDGCETAVLKPDATPVVNCGDTVADASKGLALKETNKEWVAA